MTNYFYDLPTTSKRRNPYIFPSQPQGILKIANIPALFTKIGFKLPSSYIYPRQFVSPGMYFDWQTCAADAFDVSQSLFVIADLDTDDGLDLIKESLLALVGLDVCFCFVLGSCII